MHSNVKHEMPDGVDITFHLPDIGIPIHHVLILRKLIVFQQFTVQE